MCFILLNKRASFPHLSTVRYKITPRIWKMFLSEFFDKIPSISPRPWCNYYHYGRVSQYLVSVKWQSFCPLAKQELLPPIQAQWVVSRQHIPPIIMIKNNFHFCPSTFLLKKMPYENKPTQFLSGCLLKKKRGACG